MKKHGIKLLSILLAVCMLLTVATTAGLVSFAQGKNYSTGDYVIFGSYPQKQISESDSIYSELQKLPKSWESYRYYSGTSDGYSSEPDNSSRDGKMKAGDFMYYADLSYKGERYRAVRIDKYRPSDTGFKTGESSEQQQNEFKCGVVYFFQYEPLAWRVLDPKTGLVVCESLIDAQPFNNTIYYDRDGYWQTAAKKAYANNYEKSSIRQWLLNDFYNLAFTKAEQRKIAVTYLNNGGAGSKYKGANTRDKIFLLSENDVLNPAYGFSASAFGDVSRYAYGTAYAKCQGLMETNNWQDYTRCFWWLRTPSENSATADAVIDKGRIGGYYSVSYTFYGVRPAFCFQGAIEDSWNLSAGSVDPYGAGDISGDGAVKAEDARLALRAAVGLENYKANSARFLAADVNYDKAITAEDARLILRAAVGLETLKTPAPAKSEKAAAMKAYRAEVVRIRESEEYKYGFTIQFTLYDFDENGMPELIVECLSRNGNDYFVYTYTKQNALVSLGSIYGFDDVFIDQIKGDNEFDLYFSRRGISQMFRYRIVNNRLIVKTLVELHVQCFGEFNYNEQDQILRDNDFLDASYAETYFQNLK